MSETEHHKGDVIEIKVPAFLKIGHLKRNPWIISTIVFGIISLILAWNIFYGASFSGGTISSDEAGAKIAKFLNDNAGAEVTVNDVSTESGMYKVTLDYQGGLIPIYVTKDGKYFIQSPVSLDEEPSDSGTSTDVDVFLSDSSLYPSLGPENAEITVVEFSDFQCPFCAMASGLPSWTDDYKSQYGDLIGSAKKIQEMAEEGKLRFVYVPMSFLGDESVYAAEAGLCANEQGRFWEMHDAIFSVHDSKENNGKYTKENLKILAKSVDGLDQKTFGECLDNDKYVSDVEQISELTSGIGTPKFVVNGKDVESSWAKLSEEINA